MKKEGAIFICEGEHIYFSGNKVMVSEQTGSTLAIPQLHFTHYHRTEIVILNRQTAYI